MDPVFVQNMYSHTCRKLSESQILLKKWWDLVYAGRNPDPTYVVIQLRDTARELYERANRIEDEVKKHNSRLAATAAA